MKITLPPAPWGDEPARERIAMNRLGGPLMTKTKSEAAAEARTLAARLSEHDDRRAEVLRLRATGLSVTEIGRHLGISAGAVSGFIHRARVKAGAAQ